VENNSRRYDRCICMYSTYRTRPRLPSLSKLYITTHA